MNMITGMFFIIVGVIVLKYSISMIMEMKRVQKNCYKATGIVEKIEYLPDPYRRTLPRYQVLVRYIDNFGVDYSSNIVLPLVDIKVGDSCKIMIDKKNSRLMYYDEGDSFIYAYFFCTAFILLILLGLWLFMSGMSHFPASQGVATLT